MRYIVIESDGVKYNVNIQHIIFVGEDSPNRCTVQLTNGFRLNPPVPANHILIDIDTATQSRAVLD